MDQNAIKISNHISILFYRPSFSHNIFYRIQQCETPKNKLNFSWQFDVQWTKKEKIKEATLKMKKKSIS